MADVGVGAGVHGRIPLLFRKHGTIRTFRAGEVIFEKGEDADVIYYLERGRVRAYHLYPDGSEKVLCFVESGNLVGEEVVSVPPVRIVFADAVEDSETYALKRDDLLRLMREEPDEMAELFAYFMQKITLLSSRIFYAQFLRNEEKISCLLYSQTADGSVLKYTQEEIAAVTGMSRVSVSRILDQFAEQGLIEKEYKKIQVVDRAGLLKIFKGKEFF